MRNEEAFLIYSVEKLRQYADRICACLDKLTPEQVWARGSENENAVGNLVLHLAGNVRQWIGFGIAGQENIRDRDSEFAARGDAGSGELGALLRGAVDEAIAVIGALTPERLAETTNIQGYDVTVLQAVYHVVEHFSHHAGQILFATKMLTVDGLGFYRHLQAAKHGERTP
jgi:uncharacterized damage-inducible protein DinB